MGLFKRRTATWTSVLKEPLLVGGEVRDPSHATDEAFEVQLLHPEHPGARISIRTYPVVTDGGFSVNARYEYTDDDSRWSDSGIVMAAVGVFGHVSEARAEALDLARFIASGGRTVPWAWECILGWDGQPYDAEGAVR